MDGVDTAGAGEVKLMTAAPVEISADAGDSLSTWIGRELTDRPWLVVAGIGAALLVVVLWNRRR